MKRALFVYLVLAASTFAQNPSTPNPSTFAGFYNARNFAYGYTTNPLRVVVGNPQAGSAAITLAAGTVTLRDGMVINPLATNAPVQIGFGTQLETVTPTAVNCSSPNTPNTCQFTATFSFPHGPGDQVRSGTYGLQEALNAAAAAGGGNGIVDAQWYALGGTTGIFNAATIPANTKACDNSAGAGCGSGTAGNPGGTNGQFQVNASGSFGGVAISGDVAINSSGVSTVSIPSTKLTDSSALVRNTTTTTQTMAGPFLIPRINTIFYADAYPSSCTVNSIPYTTQADCAFYTVAAAAVTANTIYTLRFGTGTYQTAACLIEPDSSTAGVTIEGVGGSETAAVNTVIQAISGCTGSVISHLDNATNLIGYLHVKHVYIDANNIAAQCLSWYGVKLTQVVDITAKHATSTTHAWVELGNPAFGGTAQACASYGCPFQVYAENVFVIGVVNGPSSYASVTAAGASPTFTVNSGGSYKFPPVTAFLIGQGAAGTAAKPCGTMGTISTTYTGTGPFVLATMTGSGFATCAGTMYVEVPDLAGTAPYGLSLNSTDSTFKDMVVVGVGTIAGIIINHGGNTLIHPHAWQTPTLFLDKNNGNTWIHPEFDSPVVFGFDEEGGNTNISGATWFWNGSYPGAQAFYINGAPINIIGSTCQGTQTAGGYHFITTSNGPQLGNPGAGTVPVGVNMVGAAECGSTQPVRDWLATGYLGAGSTVSPYSDSTSSPALIIGSGANAGNYAQFAAGRATWGYDSGANQAFSVGGNASKNFEVSIGGTGFATGLPNFFVNGTNDEVYVGGLYTSSLLTNALSVVGSENVVQLGGSATVSGNANTTGSTTYNYVIVPVAADGTFGTQSATIVISNGAASPNNTLTWGAVAGAASYQVRCTVGCSTLGLIATVSSANALAPAATYTHSSGTGDGSSTPLPTSGNATFGGNMKSAGLTGIISNVISTATPVFDASRGSLQAMNMTSNVTSLNVTNLVAGQYFTLDLVEAGSGGYTLSGVNGNITGLALTSTTLGAHNITLFYSPDGTKLYPVPSTATGSGTGTVTHTAGNLTAGQVMCGNGSADSKVCDLSGDLTTSGSTATTLATVNAGPGSCGDATHVCQVTTNGKGLVTSQTAVAITGGGGGGVSSLTSTAGSIDITGTTTVNVDVDLGYLSARYGALGGGASNNWTSTQQFNSTVATPAITITGGADPTNPTSGGIWMNTTGIPSWSPDASTLDRFVGTQSTTHTYQFFGTTTSIGGGALAAGACTSETTVTVTGATTSMTATASPAAGTNPGANATWFARVSAANTVAVKVCVGTASTPTSTTYNVAVQ